MKKLLYLLFLLTPIFGYNQILDNATNLKKRDSLDHIIQNFEFHKTKNLILLDSLNFEKIKETKKRIKDDNQIKFLDNQIKITTHKIYYLNKQISNNIRLIRRYPLPTSSTGKNQSK